jgi:hypothetical protein
MDAGFASAIVHPASFSTTLLDRWQVRTRDREVRFIIARDRVERLPTQPKLAAVRAELIASGTAAHVGRPIAAFAPATPAACAASERSIHPQVFESNHGFGQAG